MNESESMPREITISRRMFFIGAIGGGTAVAAGALSLTSVREKMFRKIDEQPLPERILTEATSNRRSAIWTFLETCAVWASVVGIGALVDRLGIQHGGRAADGELYAEKEEESPVAVYSQSCWLLPLIEEGFFRLVPSSFFVDELPGNSKMHWGTGLTSAALFAAIHNFSKPEPDKITLHLDSLPLEQFILGVYCWYAERKGGFVHAAGGHVLYNHLCECYWHLYEKKQVDRQQNDDQTNQQEPV